MSSIGFVLEKVRHGSELSTGELKMLGDEIDRLISKLEACAQELVRREEADKESRQADRDRAEKLRLAEEEVMRLRPALVHERQRREISLTTSDDRIRELTGILRDIGYGLLYQPEHSREELAGVIDRAVGSHPKPL